MIGITLHVNEGTHGVTVEPRTHLADCLRHGLLLTGTHLGCEHGVCGACTLMLDGSPVRSCITLAAACDNATITTIEGFDDDPLMAALRAAFSRHHALQCGYCTPGMLVTAYDIVRRLPLADETRIRAELAGNLCRCTGYAGIVAAIADVLRDPPSARLQHSARPAIISSATTPPAPAAAPSVAPSVASSSAPSTFAGGITLIRILPLDLSADRVWQLLRSVEQVARFLPGAVVTALDGDQVSGTVTAAIGPMRATFAGKAVVTYDDVARSGRIAGRGLDRLTRSAIDGVLTFELVAVGIAASSVNATLSYRLRGPLAQFGRPAVVEGVVDQLLARFTGNLRAAASGQPIDARPIGALSAFASLLRRAISGLFMRGA